MSIINSNILRIYGGNPTGDPSDQLPAGPSNAGVTETLVAATYRRAFQGSKRNAHLSLQTFVDQAGGAASAMTVWYSNHPNPDLTTDNDWTQDATIGSLDLTSTASKFTAVGNVFCEWVMVKVVVAVSTAKIRAFVRVEGTTI